MSIYCKDCGLPFELSEGERQFYNSKGFDSPKRCKSCRDKRKADGKYDVDISRLGYKVSSFIENAQIFGMPADVAGGLSKEFVYLICAENPNEKKYISWGEDAKSYIFVDTLEDATRHHWSSDIEEFCNQLQQMYPDYTFALMPEAYWLPIRY